MLYFPIHNIHEKKKHLTLPKVVAFRYFRVLTIQRLRASSYIRS